MRSVRAWMMMSTMLVVVGCSASSPPEPVPTTLRSVEVGTGVDADNGISGATRSFAAHDVVYVSIATEGSMPGTLTVQWYANTTLVDTETLPIHPTGPANFAFHHLPAGGWPAGKSRAIFALNAEEKHAAEFEVRPEASDVP
jgi:hypothetical protein